MTIKSVEESFTKSGIANVKSIITQINSGTSRQLKLLIVYSNSIVCLFYAARNSRRRDAIYAACVLTHEFDRGLVHSNELPRAR